jgi:hypothetical protein
MSQTTAAVLMRQAQLHRKHAEKARRLACSFSTPDVIERLEQFARDLDAKAVDLEVRARQLQGSVGRTRELAAKIQNIVVRSRMTRTSMAANDNG